MRDLTIRDIARLAGVSKTTVSRVLNKSAAVKDETRKKVLDVIEKGNYSPSEAARSLSKRISNTIGVIVPEVDNPFFGEVLRGITGIMDRYDLTMICCNSDDVAAKDLKALEMLMNHRVRGLIYTPAIDYSSNKEKRLLEKHLREINTPVVLLDRDVKGIDVDAVLFDDTEGVYQATKTLIQAGHEKIAIINATLDRYLARIRHAGYTKAMKEAGLPIENRYQFYGNYRMTKAYLLSKQLLEMEERPTAVLTCNNRTSMGFLKALYERGESIPEDMACIGLDRIEALDIVNNNFNYIKRDALQMGKQAMEMLIDRMAFPDKPRRKVLMETPLVIRKL